MRRRTHEIRIEDERERNSGAEEIAPNVSDPAPSASGSASGSAPASYEQVVDHLQRLQAEFNNYRRRVEKDRLETTVWAQRALIEKLVPVLDDLERAMGSLGGESGAAAQGLALIRDKLIGVLTEAGLERIPTRDLPFDPERHEALATQPVEPERSGKVIEELVPGFTFRGKLVRPARVTVGVDDQGDVSGPL
jgi:molecular chaperone GrpE